MAPVNNGVPETSKGLIVSFGEMLIDFVPTVSGVSLAEAPGFLKAPGGAPANVAIAVSRLGGKAAFVGKLGDDEFGHMLAGILKENGVSADGINFDQGARTALAFVTLRADGEREFMFYRNPSADMLLRPEELNLELIRSVRFLLFFLFSLIIYFPGIFLLFSTYIVMDCGRRRSCLIISPAANFFTTVSPRELTVVVGPMGSRSIDFSSGISLFVFLVNSGISLLLLVFCLKRSGFSLPKLQSSMYCVDLHALVSEWLSLKLVTASNFIDLYLTVHIHIQHTLTRTPSRDP